MLQRIIIALTLIAASFAASSAQSVADRMLFELPSVPDTITSFQGRSDYIITHFWDKANFKSALSSKQKFANTFDTYVDLMKAGSRRAVMRSIYRLLDRLQKHPAELLFVGEMAEGLMFSDTAAVPSDEAYLPFARAIADNKKISKAERARFAEQARILGQSSVGMIAPDMAYTDSVGNQRSLAADTASLVIIFFNEPDCIDCIIARGRLGANATLSGLIDKGAVKVVALTPDEPTDEWRRAVATYPRNWITGAAPDAYETFDLRRTPTFYVLDREHHIIGKNVSLEELVSLFSNI